jgi:hypothetical protein
MPHRIARYVLASAVALGALASGSAWADRFAHNGPHDGGLPASVRRVQRETGGEVLKAQPFERDGREVYRVKVLTPQGRIRVVEDEPQYGDAVPNNPRQAPVPYQRPMQPAFPRQGPQPRYVSPPRDHFPE